MALGALAPHEPLLAPPLVSPHARAWLGPLLPKEQATQAGDPSRPQLARKTSPCMVFNFGTTIGTVNIVLSTAMTSSAVNVSLEMI